MTERKIIGWRVYPGGEWVPNDGSVWAIDKPLTLPAYQTTWDRHRYTRAYLSLPRGEVHVQAAVLARLQALKAFAFPVDSGAKKLRGRAIGALRRYGAVKPEALLKGSTGAGLAGLADVVFVWRNGRAGFLEVKRPALIVDGKVQMVAGHATEEQLTFLRNAHRAGAITGVVWSAPDVDLVLRQNGVEP